MLPASLCGDRVPHPSHEWRDGWLDDAEGYWCRGRMPFTLESARAGMADVRDLRQAADWREMCERTPAGRRFLNEPEWRRLVAHLEAVAEEQEIARRMVPWWHRLLRRVGS